MFLGLSILYIYQFNSIQWISNWHQLTSAWGYFLSFLLVFSQILIHSDGNAARNPMRKKKVRSKFLIVIPFQEVFFVETIAAQTYTYRCHCPQVNSLTKVDFLFHLITFFFRFKLLDFSVRLRPFCPILRITCLFCDDYKPLKVWSGLLCQFVTPRQSLDSDPETKMRPSLHPKS